MAQDRSTITSRAQLVKLNSHGLQPPSSTPLPTIGHLVHGLVNTGNSCFLNSVLQALSSLDLFLPYLETLLEHSEMLQVAEEEVQVAEALADTLQALQQPISSHKAFRPRAIVDALGNFRRKTTTSSRGYHGNLMNREQQDAQELFQLISSALSTEELFVQKVDATRPALNISFLKNLVGLGSKKGGYDEQHHETGPVLPSFHKTLNPLSGLLASRLSCMQCGYTEAIRHFTFDNLSLSLPPTSSCYLEDCLRQYVTIESLYDVVCRKCSIQATLNRIKGDMQRIEDLDHPSLPADHDQPFSESILRRRRHTRLPSRQGRYSSDSEDDTNSLLSDTDEEEEDADDFSEDDDMDESDTDLARALRQDRLWGTNSNVSELKATLIRQQQLLEQALITDVEAPLPGVKLLNTVSRHCTKQVMLAKPPPILCLHFVRSQYSMYGTISKNGCHVRFPEYLNLSPFCTTGVLLTRPNLPISVSEHELESMGLMQASIHQRLVEPSSASTTKKKKKKKHQRQPQEQEREQQRAEPNEPSSTARESEVRYIYRLQSIVVHYGGHSYGHFIAYRRKPESLQSHAKAGPVGLGLMDESAAKMDGQGWFRISDETVESVSINQVLGANPYMLLYERVLLPGQEPTVQHRQAETCKSPGASLLASTMARNPSVVQAVGLGRRRVDDGLRGEEQTKAVIARQFDKDCLRDNRQPGDRKLEVLYHEFQHSTVQQQSQHQQSSRDGEDMSDMESLQSLDEEDGSGHRSGWRSFVSSPNSTTPPSPDTGTSACSSPSLTSPVMRQRTRLARGPQTWLSGPTGLYDGRDDAEGTDCRDDDVEELTETEDWVNNCHVQRTQNQGEQRQSDASAVPEPDVISTSLLLSSTLSKSYSGRIN
ncbi:hypothetical protein BGZ73_000779 [Actinomortierella ambigua]|nr:hypothetical protein BGZ73_000779 [Actinomortierella ambigua]